MRPLQVRISADIHHIRVRIPADIHHFVSEYLQPHVRTANVLGPEDEFAVAYPQNCCNTRLETSASCQFSAGFAATLVTDVFRTAFGTNWRLQCRVNSMFGSTVVNHRDLSACWLGLCDRVPLRCVQRCGSACICCQRDTRSYGSLETRLYSAVRVPGDNATTHLGNP
jgi:hypothetical protein